MLARTHALSVSAVPRTAHVTVNAQPPAVVPTRRDEWIHAALRVALPWLFITVALIAHG